MDRLTVAGRLGQANTARDHRLEDTLLEVRPNLGGNLGGQVRAAVEHRQDGPVDREIRVQVVADEVDRREQLGQALQGVVLALNWDEVPSAAVSAFTVSSPRDGGQSMKMWS